MPYAIVKIIAHTENKEHLSLVENFPAVEVSIDDLKQAIRKQQNLELRHLTKQGKENG